MLKIAITGPESTGKSTLAQALARYYHTVWVPEYAREYLQNICRKYTYDDILTIAQGQVELENKLLPAAREHIFVDTELLVTKIWCEHAYSKCHDWILQHLEKQQYDLYLLCDIDLPWEYDELREHPHQRAYFFDWYHRELKSRNWNFVVISGTHEQRLQNAINAVDHLSLLK